MNQPTRGIRIRKLVSALAIVPALVAAACAGTEADVGGGPRAGGPRGGGTTAGAPGGAGGTGGAGGASCSDPSLTLPTAFAACRPCHSSERGKVLGDAPSLFGFKGDAAAFERKVRAGGGVMPAFAEGAISSADALATHAYFTAPATPCPTDPGGGGGSSACGAPGQDVTPLFASAAAVAPSFEILPSGTIRTFGAGRVRGRHENELEFSKFHERYFEERSFAMTVEDTIPSGGRTLTFTWAPEHRNTRPNFRVFYTGNGNVFHVNVDMEEQAQADGTFRYTFTIDRNGRENRALAKGDLVEFEFGVFLAAPIEGRTNYYTSMFRYRVGQPGLEALSTPVKDALSGGLTTDTPIVMEPELSFEQHALNIQGSTLRSFLKGRRLFHTSFATGEHTQGLGPVVPELAQKLGPTFEQASCNGCHVRDGRGSPPADAATPLSSVVVKLTGEGVDANGAPLPHPYFGRQLQQLSVTGVPAEGEARVTYAEVPAKFDDGTAYSLLRPTYVFSKLASTAPDAKIDHFSPRVARQVVGMGLLEAIDEREILRRADPDDCDADGISGKANVVFDPQSKGMRLGRFGWKAGKASVTHQVADALVLDSGVTTSLFPTEECAPKQPECAARATKGGAPELADDRLAELVTYMRTLTVPARRGVADASVVRGAAVFASAGCPSCHAPTARTGENHPVAELRNQEIHPYSDLLLHDMGDGLADTAAEYRAESREWRTAPLWGIGLVSTVNGHSRFLHDGRARSLLEAVLWHGGEAEGAKKRVLALPAADRAALEAFLKSL